MDDSIKIDKNKFKTMNFIYNALQSGWRIKKRDNSYIFTKKHNNKQIYFTDNYISSFIETNNSNSL